MCASHWLYGSDGGEPNSCFMKSSYFWASRARPRLLGQEALKPAAREGEQDGRGIMSKRDLRVRPFEVTAR